MGEEACGIILFIAMAVGLVKGLWEGFTEEERDRKRWGRGRRG